MARILEYWYRCCGPLQRWITPGLRHSQYAYKAALGRFAAECDGLWLDAGCGRGLFPNWMRAQEPDVLRKGQRIIGLDADLPSLLDNRAITERVAGALDYAPFRAASFDMITSNMVIEHLDKPAVTLSEIGRILKPGGVFVFHTPNLWNYQVVIAAMLPDGIKRWLARFLEGRSEEDVFPTHYRLNTSARILKVASECGLIVEEIQLTNSIPETIKLGPLVAAELLTIRLSNGRRLRRFRSNIVAVLRKPGEPDRMEEPMAAWAGSASGAAAQKQVTS